MEHPQTTAKELLKNNFQMKHLETIADNGCCAFVFLWCFNLNVSDFEAIKIVSEAIEAKVIAEDCKVIWNSYAEWLLGRQLSVDFVNINNILSIHGRAPVLYRYKGKEHWIGVEKGMIKFNSLVHSECVEHGNPTEMRVLTLKGVKK